MSTGSVTTTARRAWRSRPMRVLARAGFVVNGLVHGIIGALAIGIALGASGTADQGGALEAIAATPVGQPVLWIMAVALSALGLWLILGAFLLPARDRKHAVVHTVAECGKGVAYLLLAVLAFRFAIGARSNGEAGVTSLSATLIAAPGGVIVLFLIGALVVAIGVYFVVKGVRRTFMDDVDAPNGVAGVVLERVGIVGYCAKGAALGLVGVLVAIAAIQADPSQAAGLDGSLRTLTQVPFGQVVLVLIGLGFIAYGVYCVFRARFAKLG